MLPYAAAVKHAPAPPRPGPEDPGPFSFADAARVQRMLGAAGFSGVTLTPHDFMLDVGVGEGLDNAVAKALEHRPREPRARRSARRRCAGRRRRKSARR